MSNIPHYITKNRFGGFGFGHGQLVDGLLFDGLTDATDGHPMGNCAEACADKFKFSRQDQEAYALESFRRAKEATEKGWNKDEMVPIELVTGKGDKATKTIFQVDEQLSKFVPSKIASLKPAFKKDGSVTAATSSPLSDGAAALLISTMSFAKAKGLKPIAKIIGMGDAEQAPLEFTTAPSLSIPRVYSFFLLFLLCCFCSVDFVLFCVAGHQGRRSESLQCRLFRNQ
jgi:acetyl-CoA acetyltransferase